MRNEFYMIRITDPKSGSKYWFCTPSEEPRLFYDRLVAETVSSRLTKESEVIPVQIQEVEVNRSQSIADVVGKHITNNGEAPIDSVEQIKVGDEIYVGDVKGYGGHGAYITVTRINRRSIDGVERKGSYNQGRSWRIHKNSSFAYQWIGKDGCRKSKWFNQLQER